MSNSERPYKTVSPDTLKKLEGCDGCSLSNAIEQFGVRNRNEGFVSGSIRCMFPQLSGRVGYAVTAQMRSSSTPIARRCYYDRSDWWSYVLTIPAPRFIVVQDVDERPGFGALFGEIHANICRALDCSAYLTNGSVRDLGGVQAANFQAFAASLSVSHAYAHVIEFGIPVEVGGLRISPGDLLHGDQHGVQSVPISVATEIPDKVAEIQATENELIEFCRSQSFSFEKLAEKMRHVSTKLGTPGKEL